MSTAVFSSGVAVSSAMALFIVLSKSVILPLNLVYAVSKFLFGVPVRKPLSFSPSYVPSTDCCVSFTEFMYFSMAIFSASVIMPSRNAPSTYVVRFPTAVCASSAAACASLAFSPASSAILTASSENPFKASCMASFAASTAALYVPYAVLNAE